MTTEELDLAVWPIFYAMTRRGLLVSLERTETLRAEVREQAEEQLALIEVFAGRPINPSSGDEVASYLVEQGYTGKQTKSKTRMATDERSLSMLPQDPVIDCVKEYRGLRKLEGTFLSPIIEKAGQDPSPDSLTGTIHPKWKLTRVKSGRVACEDPNLLAFPSREAIGKKVRSCFVARPGCVLVSVDYSQLEPRIVAGLSGDLRLLRIYRENRDLYTEIASALGVTRTVAKILTLGILYGMGPQRLYEQLLLAGCSAGTPPIPTYDLEACQGLIRRWFATYPQVEVLVRSTVNSARQNGGWAHTVGGRGRYLPGLFFSGRGWPAEKLREEAERQCFNHLIQGTGMEKLKEAMVRVDMLRRSGVHPLLAIHDEMIFEIPDTSPEVDARSIADTMAGSFRGVELKVSHSIGLDWSALK